MSLETNLKEAFERRATDVEAGPEAWPGLQNHLERAHQRRVTQTAILSVAIIAMIGLGVTQLPGGGTDGFAGAVPERYGFTTTITDTIGTDESIVSLAGVVDRRRNLLGATIDYGMPDDGDELIVSGDEVFYRVPERFREPGDPAWLSSSDDEQLANTVAPLAAGTIGGFVDAAAYPGAVQAAATTYTRLGGDAATTRYRATVDAKDASALIPERYRGIWEQLGAVLDDEVTITLWVDDLGRPIRTAVLATASFEGRQGSIKVVTDFDYGSQPQIEVPSRSETSPAPEGQQTTVSTFECTGTSIDGSTSGDC